MAPVTFAPAGAMTPSAEFLFVVVLFCFILFFVVFIHPFEKRDVLCYGVWRPSVNFFVSG